MSIGRAARRVFSGIPDLPEFVRFPHGRFLLRRPAAGRRSSSVARSSCAIVPGIGDEQADRAVDGVRIAELWRGGSPAADEREGRRGLRAHAPRARVLAVVDDAAVGRVEREALRRDARGVGARLVAGVAQEREEEAQELGRGLLAFLEALERRLPTSAGA
jgi:hypothetical protein